MERQDKDLAYMLQYENIAWYEDGEVRILDRRIYPAKKNFVHCKTHQEVTQAIRDMVTQSAGPFTAAAMGMALAAWECRDLPEAGQLEFLEKSFRPHLSCPSNNGQTHGSHHRRLSGSGKESARRRVRYCACDP